ncbi:MAG: formate/nitrite transporter family protein [Bacteroidales bacterium]
MGFKTPKQIVAYVETVAETKKQTPASKTFVSAILGGAYIAIGSLLALIIGGNLPGLEINNVGIQKFVFGAVFPLGLVLVGIAGAELFTGNTAYFMPSVLSKQMKWGVPLKNWTIVYIGNLVGSLVVAWLFTYYTKIIDGTHAMQYAINIGELKTSTSFGILLVKGAVCNWLVALAMWMSFAAEDIAGKFLVLWFPIMAFVSMGYEHSVANMFFIPTAIFHGANVTWYQFFVNNLIPVTLGNIIGGGFFVGMAYWYIYKK